MWRLTLYVLCLVILGSGLLIGCMSALVTGGTP